MKTIVIKSALGFFLALIITGQLFADDVFTKSFSKNYNINNKSYFLIKNKYGKVHIENWDKNEISINVLISLEADNQEKANKEFDKISIQFDQKDTLVKAITEIKENLHADELKIDYTIKMPAYLRLELSNSYGDVFIDQLTGKSLLSVRYGTFKANKLLFGDSKPRSILDLAYSEATINECDWMKFNVSYSGLNINKGEALIIKSKYSHFAIEEASSIVTDSKYDTPYTINKVENFVCTGEYSDYNVGSVSGILELDAKYSNLNVRDLNSGFEKVRIDIKYGAVKIKVAEKNSYKLDAEIEYGSLNYPKNKGTFNVNKENTEMHVSGKVGNENEPKSAIKIMGKYGEITVE